MRAEQLRGGPERTRLHACRPACTSCRGCWRFVQRGGRSYPARALMRASWCLLRWGVQEKNGLIASLRQALADATTDTNKLKRDRAQLTSVCGSPRWSTLPRVVPIGDDSLCAWRTDESHPHGATQPAVAEYGGCQRGSR